MMLYIAIIAAYYGVCTLLNGAFVTGYGIAAAYTAATVAALAFFDAAAALLTRYCIPEKKMNPFHRLFSVGKRERRLYEKLGVKKWKDVIPESGKYLADFDKRSIARPDDNEYVLKFLRETCYAEIMHAASLPLGFVTLAFLPFKLTIVLSGAIVNAFLQLLPAIVQRYNRGRLKVLYKYNLKREKLKNENS